MSTKKSTRFYNDHKVRAVWSDADSKERAAEWRELVNQVLENAEQ